MGTLNVGSGTVGMGPGVDEAGVGGEEAEEGEGGAVTTMPRAIPRS